LRSSRWHRPLQIRSDAVCEWPASVCDLTQGQGAGGEDAGDGFCVVDTASPGASRGLLEQCPDACVVREVRIRCDVRVGIARREDGRTFFGRDAFAGLADEVDPSGELLRVDFDLDEIAVAQLADRTARERFGQAPVDTPEKRASVSRATCLPKGRYFSADVT
jgi:hypothetical protein